MHWTVAYFRSEAGGCLLLAAAPELLLTVARSGSGSCLTAAAWSPHCRAAPRAPPHLTCLHFILQRKARLAPGCSRDTGSSSSRGSSVRGSTSLSRVAPGSALVSCSFTFDMSLGRHVSVSDV